MVFNSEGVGPHVLGMRVWPSAGHVPASELESPESWPEVLQYRPYVFLCCYLSVGN